VTLHVLVAAIRRVYHLCLFNVEHADDLFAAFGGIAVRSVGSNDFELRFVSSVKAKLDSDTLIINRILSRG
jgi:hypothetical protein